MADTPEDRKTKNVRDLLTKRGGQRVSVNNPRRASGDVLQNVRDEVEVAKELDAPKVDADDDRAELPVVGAAETPAPLEVAIVRPAAPPSVGDVGRKLAVMPLAALLPQVGKLSDLQSRRSALESRYNELVSAGGSVGESDAADKAGSQTAEEMMLSQVVQWLSLGGKSGA